MRSTVLAYPASPLPPDAWGLIAESENLVDPFLVPEDLSELSDAELAELRTGLGERMEELADSDLTEENVAEIEQLDQAADRIDAESQARAEVTAQRAERREAVLNKYREGPTEDEVPAEDDTVAEDEGDAPAAEDDTDEIEADDARQPVAAATEVPVESTSVVATGNKVATKRRAPASTGALSRRQSPATKPKVSRPTGGLMRATAHAPRVREGHEFSRSIDVATAVADKRKSFSHVPDGVTEYIPIATSQATFNDELGHDAVENFATLETVRDGASSLVASGAFCTPQTPLYDFFRLAEAQTPVEDVLPGVQAPRGGIRFITPPDFTLGAAAIDIQTTAQNTDPNNPLLKACARMVCPPVQEEFVVGVSQCVTFGNLQYKTFPEQTEAFLKDVGVGLASRKEVFYLDFLHGHSTAVSGITTGYGALRNHLYNLELASVGYRKRRGMKRDTPLNVIEPDWVLDVLALDAALDAYEGFESMTAGDAMVTDVYRAMNLSPAWYNDSATGAGQKFNNAQAAGAINRFPKVAQSFIFAPGTFIRLDGGTLDVGLVRDSTLNRTNDVQLFMEEWIGMAMVGLESMRLIDTVCPTGGAPAGVTATTCP